MNKEELLERAGILVTYSSIEVPSFRASSLVNTRAKRFTDLQQEVVRHDWDHRIVLAMHLVAFDGFDPFDFDLIRTHKVAFRTTTFGLALELSNDEEVVRRYLLGLLTQKFSAVPLVWDEVQELTWVEALKTLKPYAHFNEAEILIELRCDQLAWAFQRLPSALFSHLSGLIPSTPLSRDTWERMRTGAAPLARGEVLDTEADANSGDLLDAAENSSSDNNSPALIQQALNCLSAEPHETARQCLTRWNRNLTALAPKLHGYSPHIGLIISWIAHVVEHGTSKKGSEADTATRRRYANVAAIPLFRAIQSYSTDPGRWTKDMRVAAFVSVMSSASNTDKRALSAAIASFQFFLMEAFELRPLDAGLKDFVPVSKPRAQCIFLAEVERTSSWFAAARMDDERLRSRLQVALWLSYDAPFRINELLHLRKGNILKLKDGSYEVSIIPPRGGQLKTSAAIRRVWVRLPTACAFLARLLEQREREGWASKDLLFGAGVEGGVPYRKSRLRYMLLLALKATTGDPDMTIHALRHSWVCRELEALLVSSEVCNFNRLSHLATQVGHASVHTTLEYYFHLMERPWRMHIDVALQFELKWTSDTGARYTDMSPPALRQRASRANQTVDALIWTRLHASAVENIDTLTPVDVVWGIPCSPDLTDKALTPLTPALIMLFLIAVEKAEHPPEVLAQRYGLSSEQGRSALLHLSEVRTQLSRTSYTRRSTRNRTVDRNAPDLRIQKIQQPKYARLVASLGEITVDLELQRRGVDAWKVLRNRYGYIGLVDRNATYNFLSLLQHLGLHAHNLDVLIAQSDEPGFADSTQAQIEGVFLSAMVAHPTYIQGAPPHPTRPAAFLQWHPSGHEKKTPANSDLKGLDSIMLVLAVFLHLCKK